MINLEQDIEKDSRCLYKYRMIYSPMAEYIIQSICKFIIILYTLFQKSYDFYLKIMQFFLTFHRDINIIHFKKNIEG